MGFRAPSPQGDVEVQRGGIWTKGDRDKGAVGHPEGVEGDLAPLVDRYPARRGRNRRNRSELLTTETEERAMAADASMGSKSMPNRG